jgi:drug/metabolite transporter (DMT)-like permease
MAMNWILIRSKYIDSSIAYLAISCSLNVVILVGLFFIKIQSPDILFTILGLIAGILHGVAALIYIKAISLEEVSRVIPLMRFESIFVILFATVFLNEILTPIRYIAFFMILTGGFMLSIRKTVGVFKLSKAFYLMILTSILFSAGDVILKYLSSFMEFHSYFFLQRIGTILFVLFLFLIPTYYKKTILNIKRLNLKSISLVFTAQMLALVGIYVFFYAISIAPVSLVNVLIGFQPLFVLIIASFLSFKFPQILKEELNKKVLLTKMFAIILLISGLFLIQNGVP